jgi:hypothetical protein
MLKQAVERYPNYAPAHSMLAFAMLVSRLLGWTLIAPQVKEAATLAARAAELDDSDPWAHLALGYVAHTMRRTDDASDKSPRLHNLREPTIQLFVAGNFKEKPIVNKPHFACLPHTGVEAEECYRRNAIDLDSCFSCITPEGASNLNRSGVILVSLVGTM